MCIVFFSVFIIITLKKKINSCSLKNIYANKKESVELKEGYDGTGKERGVLYDKTSHTDCG